MSDAANYRIVTLRGGKDMPLAMTPERLVAVLEEHHSKGWRLSGIVNLADQAWFVYSREEKE